MSLSVLPKFVRKYWDSDSVAETTTSPLQRRVVDAPALSELRIPDRIHRVQYAVRGILASRSLEIADELAKGETKYQFDKILPCHIGNPMALPGSYIPLSYVRETVALCSAEKLLDQPTATFHPDNIARAKKYLASIQSPGCYTNSLGGEIFREVVARFLHERDVPKDRRDELLPPRLDTIMMTDGASDAVDTLLSCLIQDESDGILCPIPQYPLYSALITKFEGTVVPYYLDEPNDWSLNILDLHSAYDRAIENGINVKGLVIISPGNPVPTFFDEELIEETLKFALERNILVIADEVYQSNCYTKSFVSFRQVLLKYNLGTQLASLHSVSKGFTGECGYRAGFAQLENVDAATLKIVYKMRSIKLCANTCGQIVLASVLDPPKPDQDSYESYIKEKNENLDNLKIKAKFVYEFFNSIPNISCRPIHGALYAFPSIQMPKKAIADAEAEGISVDLFYCRHMLEETGIVTVNGDGFGQKPDTHHFRMTILPNLNDLKTGLERFRLFHISFIQNFS